LRAQAGQILKEAKVPTPASISDRLRAKSESHARWAADMEQRLDAIDAMEAQALPIIESEMQARERAAESVHNDALAIRQLADAITKGSNASPTVTSQALPRGSGADALRNNSDVSPRATEESPQAKESSDGAHHDNAA
jgi:hypothetical protein